MDPNPENRRLRALVVDGDEQYLAFAAEALNSFRPGFDVATARDAKQAGEWLDAFSPDLLVLASDDEALESLARSIRDRQSAGCRVVRSRKPASLTTLLHDVRATVDRNR